MDSVSRRTHAVLHHWATAPALLAIAAVCLIELDRFPQWDESVFMTQTAGKNGAEAPPAFLGPTREIGSVWKIAALSQLAASYPNLRLLHILLMIAVLAFSAHIIARSSGLPAAVVGLVMGSYWVTFAYLGQLLRFVLVSFVLLAAVGIAAKVLDSDHFALRSATALGSIFVVGLALGPLEAGLVLASVGSYLLVAGKAWKNPKPFLVLAGLVTAGGVLLLIFDTIPRYGSLSARVDAIAAMTGPTSTSGFDWSLVDDYLSLVLSGPVSNSNWAPDGVVPQLGYLFSAILMAAGVLLVARSGLDLVRRRPVDHLAGMLSLVAVVLVVFLAGFYGAQADRYFILPGSALMLLGLIALRRIGNWAEERAEFRTDSRPWRPLVVVAVLFVFSVPNIAAAVELDSNWAAGTQLDAAVLELVRSEFSEEPCRGIARYNTPSVQWATGCRVSSSGSIEEALEAGMNNGDSGHFVYWNSAELSSEARSLIRRGGWTPLLAGDNAVGSKQVWLRR